jgi:hypothetical protein
VPELRAGYSLVHIYCDVTYCNIYCDVTYSGTASTLYMLYVTGFASKDSDCLSFAQQQGRPLIDARLLGCTVCARCTLGARLIVVDDQQGVRLNALQSGGGWLRAFAHCCLITAEWGRLAQSLCTLLFDRCRVGLQRPHSCAQLYSGRTAVRKSSQPASPTLRRAHSCVQKLTISLPYSAAAAQLCAKADNQPSLLCSGRTAVRKS